MHDAVWCLHSHRHSAFLACTASRCWRGYILLLWFFFVFRRLISWGHWTDLNQTWKHIHWWLLFEKFGPNSPGHLPPKTAFLGRTLNFDRTYLCNGMWYQKSERNVNLQGLPNVLPNLVNFGPETAENGWRVFANPPKFLHWETLPALPHGRYITASKRWHVLCTGMNLQARTAECWAGSRWALPCI